MGLSPRLLRPQATGFNPKSISGLALWVDASNFGSVTRNSGNASQLNDLSGNGRHLTQSTAANQPEYLFAARNGLNVLDFGPANGKNMAQASGTGFTLSQPLTFFWVFKTPASGSYTLSDVTNAAVDGTGRINCYGNTATEMRFEAGVSNATTVVADTWYVVSCVFNATSSVRRINTLTGTTFSAGTRSYSDRLVIGANYGLSSGLRSLFGEIGVYSGALSDSQHASLLKYLAKKWAITLT
jgi:hypothetical protein